MSKKYIGIKIVRAEKLPIEDISKILGRPLNTSVDSPASSDGYLVTYADGYQSYSPIRAFEEAYIEMENSSDKELYSFGIGLEMIKRKPNMAIRKPSWGKGDYVKVVDGAIIAMMGGRESYFHISTNELLKEDWEVIFILR